MFILFGISKESAENQRMNYSRWLLSWYNQLDKWPEMAVSNQIYWMRDHSADPFKYRDFEIIF